MTKQNEITWDNLKEGDVVIDRFGVEYSIGGKRKCFVLAERETNYTIEEFKNSGYTIKQPSPPLKLTETEAISRLEKIEGRKIIIKRDKYEKNICF